MNIKETMQALLDGKRIAKKKANGESTFVRLNALGNLVGENNEESSLLLSSGKKYELYTDERLIKAEKELLRSVLRLGNKSTTIKKTTLSMFNALYERITITTKKAQVDFKTELPPFVKGTAFEWLEEGKTYTMEELKL